MVAKSNSKCWFSRANFALERLLQLNAEVQVCFHLGAVTRYVQARKYRSKVGAASRSDVFAARTVKVVCGWRFAPACCAAQLVNQRGPGSTARLHARLGPLILAAPVGRIDASAQQKRNSSRFAPSKCSTLKAHAVPPNHSVNRTHCGGPPFGL